jgi:NAD(P)-dependent dehydrogenase (short-subunit alcohol dehydrogenase family)
LRAFRLRASLKMELSLQCRKLVGSIKENLGADTRKFEVARFLSVFANNAGIVCHRGKARQEKDPYFAKTIALHSLKLVTYLPGDVILMRCQGKIFGRITSLKRRMIRWGCRIFFDEADRSTKLVQHCWAVQSSTCQSNLNEVFRI